MREADTSPLGSLRQSDPPAVEAAVCNCANSVRPLTRYKIEPYDEMALQLAGVIERVEGVMLELGERVALGCAKSRTNALVDQAPAAQDIPKTTKT
jgi:hypothetical protein